MTNFHARDANSIVSDTISIFLINGAPIFIASLLPITFPAIFEMANGIANAYNTLPFNANAIRLPTPVVRLNILALVALVVVLLFHSSPEPRLRGG
jgi:hypothetical protein